MRSWTVVESSRSVTARLARTFSLAAEDLIQWMSASDTSALPWLRLGQR
jgi:hypothetical protein